MTEAQKAAASKAEAKKKAAELAKAKKPASRATAVLNVPVKTGEGLPKHPRSGTKRETVINMLRKGATMEAVQEHFDWSRRNTVECFRILHNEYGFGFATDAKTGVTKILGA